MTFLAVLLGLFVLTYLTIGAAVLRRPLIGRIAVREASRRPGQTAVLVLGLMIAGAAIFSVQVVFDSMYETNRAQVLRNWGRDDIEVSAGGAYFDGAMAQRITTDRAVCSCIAGIQNAIVTSGSVVDVTREAGRPNVQISGLDIAAERRFGAFVLADGRSTFGDELNSGDVFVTQPLADALGAQHGDRLRITAGGASSVDVMVAGIVEREGAGAYGFDLSMFASLKTLQQVEGGDGVNLIRVSARGDGDAEVAGARGLAGEIRGFLAANHLSLQVLEVKRGALDIVDMASASGRSFVTSFGVIIALAATALVANLAVMLSEERRPRLSSPSPKARFTACWARSPGFRSALRPYTYSSAAPHRRRAPPTCSRCTLSRCSARWQRLPCSTWSRCCWLRCGPREWRSLRQFATCLSPLKPSAHRGSVRSSWPGSLWLVSARCCRDTWNTGCWAGH